MLEDMRTPVQLAVAYDRLGSLRAIARETGATRHCVRTLYKKAVEQGLITPVEKKSDKEVVVERGQVESMDTREFSLPPKGKVKRYLFTCAQNNTKVHTPLWDNLCALARHYQAPIHVSRYTYIKNGLGASGDKAQVTKKEDVLGDTGLRWAAELNPYFSDERIEVAPGLVWCGEMNILPTAVNPLSGLQVYTGRKSSIFPHAKIAMESIPSGKTEPPKFNYTTGTVTLRNYIQRKAGLKAEFHHGYGALLVEVNHDGDWWCRQINADNSGTIYDLDTKVENCRVTTGHRVDSIYWGDIHICESDPKYIEMAFAEGGMKDVLKPKADFMGDIISWKARSHHEMKNPHVMYKRFIQGLDNAEVEIEMAAKFLKQVKRQWCDTYAVNGNHERHLGQWLKEHDGRQDPVNVIFWLKMQLEVYYRITHELPEANFLDLALKLVDPDSRNGIKFLAEDESVIRCSDAQGGIECGSHGDQGARGAKGTAKGFARLGRKRNIGDKHSAGIVEGVYVAGTFSAQDVDWAKGPSDWSASHIVTYPNGKRAIVTMWNGQWKA